MVIVQALLLLTSLINKATPQNILVHPGETPRNIHFHLGLPGQGGEGEGGEDDGGEAEGGEEKGGEAEGAEEEGQDYQDYQSTPVGHCRGQYFCMKSC